ncbi:MAG: homoserine dehydrogenase [Ruminococcaceae bacterium]|nr:homoserine dehydrogenase [Oscillospiraceae bacterium]
MINIAILGFGTVGSGVYEVLKKDGGIIAGRVGDAVRIKYIVEIRDFSDHPDAQLFTKDYSAVLTDNSVSVVVEMMGGIEPAYSFTKDAILHGKSVVTSNKALVAEKGAELFALARENGVFYRYEASVGGGIPVIRPIGTCLAANRITRVMGILNGTTNYILTKMIEEGQSFETALADAQKKGYAEADPTADVEGHDTCRKIAILASLIFGKNVDYKKISTEGITGVEPEDVEYAEAMDSSIKLIGMARIGEDKVFARVSPMLIPNDSPLACVKDVFNAVMLTGDNVGDVMLYGSGAGKLPTASAVVSDVIDIARGISENRRLDWEDGDSSYVTPLSETKVTCLIRSKEEIEDATCIDIGIEGEKGYILRNFKESDLEALLKREGVIKCIRM